MSAVANNETGLQVVQPTPIATPNRGPRLGLPDRSELDTLLAYGAVMIKSGMAPAHIKTAEAALVVMRYGHQLGIDEFTALQNIYVIQGRPAAFASLLHSLILRDHGGGAITVKKLTNEEVIVVCRRRDTAEVATITYSIAEAKLAGVYKANPTWEKYPTDMLFARCISRAGRIVYRDSTMGMYTPEELGTSVIEVNGEVVDDRPASEPGTDVPLSTPVDRAMASLHAQANERGIGHDLLHDLAVAAYGVDSLTECDPPQLNGIRRVLMDCTTDQFYEVLTFAQAIAAETEWERIVSLGGEVERLKLPELAVRLLKATSSRTNTGRVAGN